MIQVDDPMGSASLRRIDVIMGTLVAIGVVISGWAYFRSSTRRANAKRRIEEANGKIKQVGAGGGKREGETVSRFVEAHQLI